MIYRLTMFINCEEEELQGRVSNPRDFLSHSDIIDNFFEPLSEEEQKEVIEHYNLYIKMPKGRPQAP